MFYSHEVLTSRKYGVATVWLVATLGAKSAFKKVNRKAIFHVNVPKACDTISQPEVPMALRLQSNLLFGVSQVYAQQCHYVMLDAQQAYTSMKQVIRVVKIADIEAEIPKVRSEQLQLQDDPAFAPDIMHFPLDIDLDDILALHSERARSSSMLTPQRSRASIREGGPVGGLIIPSETTDMDEFGAFIVHGDDGREMSRPGGQSSLSGRAEQEGFDPFADFGFDDDGNIFDIEPHPATPVAHMPLQLGSDTAASAQVRAEHEEARHGLPSMALNDEQLPSIEDGFALLDADALGFSGSEPAQAPQDPASATTVDVVSSTSTASAPLRRKARTRKILRLDRKLELRSSELVDWNNNYVIHMRKARAAKKQQRSITQAKKNAEWLVRGCGIGNIGNGIGSHALAGPLSMFCGDSLWEMITGQSDEDEHGVKRSRESDPDASDDDEESRRVRQRSNEDAEIGRGDVSQLLDDLGLQVMDDDVEIPREAIPGLDDISSAMPWNISASIRGSSVGHGRDFPSGLARSVSASIGRGRMVSASPLAGRGPNLDTLPDIEIIDDEDPLQQEEDIDRQEYEKFGPAAAVGTQEAGQSQWVRDVLDKESNNFLGFIEYGIEQKKERAAIEGSQGDGRVSEVTFEELLPPTQNSRIVASQAFLHVLSLSTKNLISVRQDADFGTIGLSVIDSF